MFFTSVQNLRWDSLLSKSSAVDIAIYSIKSNHAEQYTLLKLWPSRIGIGIDIGTYSSTSTRTGFYASILAKTYDAIVGRNRKDSTWYFWWWAPCTKWGVVFIIHCLFISGFFFFGVVILVQSWNKLPYTWVLPCGPPCWCNRSIIEGSNPLSIPFVPGNERLLSLGRIPLDL